MNTELDSDSLSTSGEEIIYAVSHDLRGPVLNFQGFLRRLSTACGNLGVLARQWPMTSEQRRCWDELLGGSIQPSLEVLERTARRMDHLLHALLELARAGREPLCLTHISTSELARQVAEEFLPLAKEKGATVVIESMPGLRADGERMRQILRHLMANALQFLSSDRPGRICVGGRSDEGEDICWVQDNGIGLRAEDRKRLFLPFGRVREIDGPGEGMGLATVRKLVEQQGGRAWVESVHGEGSTFFVALPATLDSR